MDAVKYFKERDRLLNSLGRKGDLCTGIHCEDCPFHTNTQCIIKKTESVEIVEKWSAEHPQKTILQDFLEKYPNAPKEEDGKPMDVCPFHLGYATNKSCLKMNCEDCWNRPLEG